MKITIAYENDEFVFTVEDDAGYEEVFTISELDDAIEAVIDLLEKLNTLDDLEVDDFIDGLEGYK